LFGQGRRQIVGGGGDDDRVVRGVFRPTVISISLLDVDVVVTQALQARAGAFGQFGDDLDGVDLQAGDFPQDGGLVSGTGADLQDFVPLL